MAKAELGLSLGTVRPTSSNHLVNDQVSLYLPPNSFNEEAVVAVFPSQMTEVGAKLIPLSKAYSVYSPKDYVEHRDSRIGFQHASLAEVAGSGIYRWDPRPD